MTGYELSYPGQELGVFMLFAASTTERRIQTINENFIIMSFY